MYAHQKMAWKIAHRIEWLRSHEHTAATGIPTM
jgi:hypothetical protein